jgi:hypothetical protein
MRKLRHQSRIERSFQFEPQTAPQNAAENRVEDRFQSRGQRSADIRSHERSELTSQFRVDGAVENASQTRSPSKDPVPMPLRASCSELVACGLRLPPRRLAELVLTLRDGKTQRRFLGCAAARQAVGY